MLLTNDDGKSILIDCGSDARLALHELGKTHKDISDVYISHLHADHAGGLEWLAFSKKFDSNCNKPNLFICERLKEDLWNHVLSGGLSSIQTEVASLEYYFNVNPIKENGTFIWENIEFRIVQTIHVMDGFRIMPSYGLIFTVDGLKVFITTDSQVAPYQIRDLYKSVDIIFQDCEVSDCKSHVHANYNELITLDESIKNKMWLYHYNSSTLPDAVKDGFRGFVKKGQCFDFTKPETLK